MAKSTNGHGGARKGAGRPQRPLQLVDLQPSADPLSFLLAVMNEESIDTRLRVDAAKALLPFMHVRLAKAGLKEIKNQDARAAVTGRFAPSSGPRLQVGRIVQMMPVSGRSDESAG